MNKSMQSQFKVMSSIWYATVNFENCYCCERHVTVSSDLFPWFKVMHWNNHNIYYYQSSLSYTGRDRTSGGDIVLTLFWAKPNSKAIALFINNNSENLPLHAQQTCGSIRTQEQHSISP